MTTAALVREEFYCRTAALHYRVWRARVMLTRLTAHVAAKRQNREAFSPRTVGRFRLPRCVEASDMEQAASLDITRGFADASGVRDADATGGLCSFAAASHRHRAALKAAINLQALARGAESRRCLRCLAQKRACAILLRDAVEGTRSHPPLPSDENRCAC